MPLLPHLTSEPGNTPNACVIWLHGLGADGFDFVNLLPQLSLPKDHKIRFIFPHAPKMPVTINGGMRMPAWYDILVLGEEIKSDKEGVERSEKAMLEFIESQIADGIPAKRIVLAGFSQGGAIALHTGLQYKEDLAGILALSTYVPVPDEMEINNKTPVYMAHGRQDPVVLPDRAKASHDLLVEKGVDINYHLYEMQHSLCAEEVQDICGKLKEWLK